MNSNERPTMYRTSDLMAEVITLLEDYRESEGHSYTVADTEVSDVTSDRAAVVTVAAKDGTLTEFLVTFRALGE